MIENVEDLSSWKYIFDSVPGTSHESSGQPCQDCCDVTLLQVGDCEFLVAICADGAGSSSHSHEGARIACNVWLNLTKQYMQQSDSIRSIDADVIQTWCDAIRQQIEVKANEMEVPIRELATTVLGCVIGPANALFLQIGDGAMVYRSNESLEVAFWPQSGEYANMTNFITSDDFLSRVEWRIVDERVSDLFAFTDGLERLFLLFAERSVHEPAIEPMLAEVRRVNSIGKLQQPMREFLGSKEVNDRTDDDKSLVIAIRATDDESIL